MGYKSKISLILTTLILSSISGAAIAAGPGSAAPSGNLPDAKFNSVTANTTSGNAVFGQSSSATAWSIYGFSPSTVAVGAITTAGANAMLVWNMGSGDGIRTNSASGDAIYARGGDNAGIFENTSNGIITYISTKAGGAGSLARGILTKGDIEGWFDLILKGAAYNNNPAEPFKIGDTDGFRVQDAPTAPGKYLDISPNGKIDLTDASVPAPFVEISDDLKVIGKITSNSFFSGPDAGQTRVNFMGGINLNGGIQNDLQATFNPAWTVLQKQTECSNRGGTWIFTPTPANNYCNMPFTVADNLSLYGTSKRVIFDTNGNIKTYGLPQITIQSNLEVTGDITGDNNINAAAFHGQCAGTLAGKCSDFAEVYQTNTLTEPGDLLMIDKNDSSKLSKAIRAKDNILVGIVSSSAGVILGVEGKAVMGGDTTQYINSKQTVMGLAGQLNAKVSTENGSIEIGDLITISSEAGVGMKANDGDASVGIALEAYSGKGVGKINVLVSRNNGASELIRGLKDKVNQLENRLEKIEKLLK